jgi:branched-chain amino acid transport system ATP-binding protein
MSTAALLSVSDLHAAYGRAEVLFGIDLEVRAGEVVALMGRNGAGKSTTLKAIMGLIPGARGDIRFEGRPLAGLEAFQIARSGLGYVPEERRIFTELSVLENLEVGRQAPRPGVPSWDAQKLMRLFPNLRELEARLGGQMSGGEQQMLTVARTLMGNPRLVLLDEPSEGIAPKIVEDLANSIVSLKQEGLSILLCEQNLHFAQLVSDRAYVIEKGQVKYHGTMAELAANQEVKREYLAV